MAGAGFGKAGFAQVRYGKPRPGIVRQGEAGHGMGVYDAERNPITTKQHLKAILEARKKLKILAREYDVDKS